MAARKGVVELQTRAGENICRSSGAYSSETARSKTAYQSILAIAIQPFAITRRLSFETSSIVWSFATLREEFLRGRRLRNQDGASGSARPATFYRDGCNHNPQSHPIIPRELNTSLASSPSCFSSRRSFLVQGRSPSVSCGQRLARRLPQALTKINTCATHMPAISERLDMTAASLC